MSKKKTTKLPKMFSKTELAAMRERARELRDRTDGEAAVQAKIATMSEPERSMAKKIHALVKKSAPALKPKTWYGMPAYAKGEKVVCYFKNGKKYKERYSTFGFNDTAKLDTGNLWPTSFALVRLTSAEERKISAMVRKAAN